MKQYDKYMIKWYYMIIFIIVYIIWVKKSKTKSLDYSKSSTLKIYKPFDNNKQNVHLKSTKKVKIVFKTQFPSV